MGLRQKNGSLLYSILEIPDEFGSDRVLKIILDLGWVSEKSEKSLSEKN